MTNNRAAHEIQSFNCLHFFSHCPKMIKVGGTLEDTAPTILLSARLARNPRILKSNLV